MAIFAGIRPPFFGTEDVFAFRTTVPPRHNPSNPLLYSALEELQVNQIVAHLPTLFDLCASTLGTSLALYGVHLIDTNRGSFKLPVLPVDDFEVGVRAYEYFLALVVKVGTLCNLLKVLRSVFPRPKHVPSRSVPSQILGLSRLERNLRKRCYSGIRLGELPDDFEDVL